MGGRLKSGGTPHELTKADRAKGGRNSSKGKQKLRTMREALQIINKLPLPKNTAATLQKLGIEDDELCYPVAVMYAQMAKAAKGDVQAAKFLSELNGEMVQKLAVSNVTDDSTNAFNAFLAEKDNGKADE